MNVMNMKDTTTEELKGRAKAGDLEALQILRASGFFRKKKAAKEGYALSHAQRRMWVLDQMEDISSAYNIPGAILLEGKLYTSVFQKALETVVNRHESLRTTFVDIGGGPWQIIHDKVDLHIDEIDLSSEVDSEKTAQEYVLRDATTPFDLSKGPLLRVKLLKTAKDRHVLIYCIHHIVCDAWSMNVMVEELMVLYTAYSKGLDNPLQSLKIQYKDYTAWQNKLLESSEAESHREYWHKKLSGKLQPLNLPTSYSRPDILTYNGDTLLFTLESSVRNNLYKLGQKYGTSLFIILSSIVKVLLYRYTGQEDVVVGSAVAGRDHPDLENQIGFYVNTIALRDNIKGEDSFDAVIRKVKQTTEEAFEHEVYPFNRLVEDLDLDRKMDHSPVFDVMVNHQDSRESEFRLGDVKTSEFKTDYSTAKYDLTFLFEETTNGLNFSINYNTDIFSRERVGNMVRHFNRLIIEVFNNTSLPIMNLNILSVSEKNQLIVEFNDTTAKYPENKTIIKLFEDQVERTPENIAVVFEDTEEKIKRIKYKKLNTHANRVAWHLKNVYDVGPEDRVAVMLSPSDWMVIGLLGILKTGSSYVPIDCTYSKERIGFMLEDSECKVILMEEKHKELIESCLPNGISKHPLVDIRAIKTEDLLNPPQVAFPDHAAYVIYTSGSTGRPKGCVITHRNVVRLLKNDRCLFDFKDNDVWVIAHSFCFDFSVWEMYGALLFGGRAVVAKREDVRDIDAFLKLLQRHRVTVLNQTPAAFYNLMEVEGECKKNDLNGHLRYVIFGGDKLDPTYLRPWIERYSLRDIQLINMYGITETTVHVTYYKIQEQDIIGKAGQSPIGRPLPETKVYVCNENMNLQPIGIVGELYVGGTGVSRGYLNNQKLTTERFIDSPFQKGERLYRTGDIGRWLEDGSLEHLGRNDDQVQIRGFRVELGEIEAALSQHKAISKNVAIIREDVTDDKRLIAYIVPHAFIDKGKNVWNSSTALINDLRKFIEQKLPDYMIPSAFVILDRLPLTPNGKIDKLALPVPEENTLEDNGRYKAPCYGTEKDLAQIWSVLLNRKKVGTHDNFFELGGHSLKATQMVSRIYKDLNVKISLRDVFRSPTINELARAIQNVKPSVFVRIEPVPNAEYYPVSNAQRRLWILERMGAEKAAYNISGANLLEGDLDIKALGKALQTLIVRHESLRTTFFEMDDGPKQKIHKSIESQLKVLDLMQESVPELKARELVLKEALLPFDLEQGPLFKAKLFRLAEKRYVFFFNMHHIISDGWSMEIIVKEMLVLYTAFVEGKESPLLPLRIQYRDFTDWQNGLLSGAEANVHLDYWQGKLSGDIPSLVLPLDYRRPAIQTFKGDAFQFSLEDSITEGLRKLGREYGASFFMVMLSLVKILLYRYTGQEDIIVGSPIAGRDHADLEEQVGFYVNMLALRDEIKGQDSFVRVLENVRETATNAFDHQVYPFDRLVEELQIKRDMGRSPLFDVVVATQNANNNVPEINSIKKSDFEFHSKISKFDLAFFFTELEEGGCVVGIEYSTDLFLGERIERMAGHFQELANGVLEDKDIPVKSLNIMQEWERQKVLFQYNDTHQVYPGNKTIVEMFQEQTLKSPDAVAVVFEKQRMTYGELNNRANQMAYYLKNKGVTPNSFVALMKERGPDMIVSILGVLKVGAAYLPIDIKSPMGRIIAIINDSKPRVLLTDSFVLKDPAFSKLKGHLEEIILQDKAIKDIEQADNRNPEKVSCANDLAYVMYTSGSTGQPKGVLVEHRNVIRLVKNTNYTDIKSGDRILQLSNYAFDGSVFDIFGALLNGASIYIVPLEILYSMEELGAFIENNNINITFITTALINQLIDTCPEVIKNFDKIYFGGQDASLKHIRTVLKYRKKTDSIVHVYGPTEGTTFSTYYVVNEIKDTGISIPIGAPISNSRIYILDRYLNPVPTGVEGEIYIEGDGIARGYLNNDELTSEKFLKDPFGEGRLYKTGDFGKWLPDGNVVFSGRKDNQVKIRGFRVETAEIESCLLKHPSIKQVFVMARQSENGNKELIAYVVSEEELQSTGLKQYMSQALPDYMIPSFFVKLNILPLDPVTGKVDKKSLPDADISNIETGTEYEGPRNKGERVLVNIWQEVLSVKRIGIHDNYFVLGGDSIKAIQLANRMMRKGWKMEIRNLFQYPTIATLTPHLRRIEGPVECDITSGPVPLTAVQQWFFKGHEGPLHHFNQSVLLRRKGAVDEKALQAVLEKIWEHHDALRTIYQINEGGIKQVIVESDQPISLNILDLRNTEQWKSTLEKHVNELHTGFNLEKGPLMKVVLYRLDGEDRVFLAAHHLVVDGVSWRIILEDLEKGYLQYIEGKEIDFGPKTVSFKRWAEEVGAYGKSKTLLQELPYWTKTETSQTAILSRDLQEGDLQEGDLQEGDLNAESNLYGDCSMVDASLPEEETKALTTVVHHAYNTEMNDILLTSLGRALKRWHGKDVIRILMEGHGREPLDKEWDVSRTVGWFTSMYPFLLEVTGEEIGYQIKQIKESLRRVPGKGVGYGILSLISPEETRKKMHNGPTPQISFNYLGHFEEGGGKGFFEFAAESSGQPISPLLQRHHDLDVGGILVRGKLNLYIAYNSRTYRRESVEKLLSNYKEELLAVIAHCENKKEEEKTPSDFTHSTLSTDDYNSILEKIR